MNDNFIELANSLKNQCLLSTEYLFADNRQVWMAGFANHFKELCGNIEKMQEEDTLPPVSYIEYTMLYTNFINRRYIAEIIVYGGRHYLDKGQKIIGEYDISFLFVYFDELWDKLLTARKMFAGFVTSQDVASFMVMAIPDFYSYFTNIVRFAAAGAINEGAISNILKGDLFMINVGEYMAKTEPVYTEKKNKNQEELIKWFMEELDLVYMCGDYSDLDFSEISFSYNNFCYANFKNTSLSNTSFEGALLVGTTFRNCHMENCILEKAHINEGDFTNAVLTGANFSKVYANAGICDDKKWWHVGFLPVVFRNANLTNAIFRKADLTGADFTGANLTKADFTGAILTGADFTNTIRDGAIFDSHIQF